MEKRIINQDPDYVFDDQSSIINSQKEGSLPESEETGTKLTNQEEKKAQVHRITNLKTALHNLKNSRAGLRPAQTRISEIDATPAKTPFSLKYLLKFWTTPPGLNNSIAMYLDLNTRLLILVGALVLGTSLLMHQTRVSYCKFYSNKLEDTSCEQKFSLYSYLIDAVYIENYSFKFGLFKDLKAFLEEIKIGVAVFIWTIWALPFLFLWQFKRHYDLGLRLKYSQKEK